MRARTVVALTAALLISDGGPTEAQQRFEREFRLGPFLERNQQDRSDGQEDHRDEGMMVCSAYVADIWRDTIPVPDSWRPRDCFEFARIIGAAQYNLGCIFESGRVRFSLGQPGSVQARESGSLPEQNCGWRSRRQR